MLEACFFTPKLISDLCVSCSVIDASLSFRLYFWKGLWCECHAVLKSRLIEAACITWGKKIKTLGVRERLFNWNASRSDDVVLMIHLTRSNSYFSLKVEITYASYWSLFKQCELWDESKSMDPGFWLMCYKHLSKSGIKALSISLNAEVNWVYLADGWSNIARKRTSGQECRAEMSCQ